MSVGARIKLRKQPARNDDHTQTHARCHRQPCCSRSGRTGCRTGTRCHGTRKEGNNADHPQRPQPSGKGPAEYFTGSVRIDPLFQAPDPARVGGATVTFEPGARTAWHTHPLGQTLIVTSGLGWVQVEGGPKRRSVPAIWSGFRPGEKHWHGATPTTAHDPYRDRGSARRQDVDWMEHVTDEQYAKTTTSR